MTRQQKFVHILGEENKMAKWSIFENLPFYATSADSAAKIFEALCVPMMRFRNAFRSCSRS